MKCLSIAVVLSALATAASSDIVTAFQESAPKDSFTVENRSGCPLGHMTVSIDLAGSTAGLIFGATGAGAGVQVYEPFMLVAGADLVENAPAVGDDYTAVSLDLSGLAEGRSVAFSIDVDDTVETCGTMISGAEITGATVTIAAASLTGTAMFDATALLPVTTCTS